jgi:outer membrane biosynthesis protein TonB
MRNTVTNPLWLAPVLGSMLMLGGCNEKVKPAQQQAPQQALAPPIVDAPPPKPASVSTADLPPPVVGPPPQSATVAETQPKPVEPPKKPARHPKPPVTTPVPAPAPTQPTQDAAVVPPVTTPSVSAIGELSGGASGDQRTQTESSINLTEKGLASITRPLSDSESKTAAQIREFLKQARVALTSGDVDGAVTLNKKARVLLAELNQ